MEVLESMIEKVKKIQLTTCPIHQSVAEDKIYDAIRTLRQKITDFYGKVFPMKGDSLRDRIIRVTIAIDKFGDPKHLKKNRRELEETIKTTCSVFEENVKLLFAKNIDQDNVKFLKKELSTLSNDYASFESELTNAETLVAAHRKEVFGFKIQKPEIAPKLPKKTSELLTEPTAKKDSREKVPPKKNLPIAKLSAEPTPTKEASKEEVEPKNSQATQLSMSPVSAKKMTPPVSSLSLQETLDTVENIIHGVIKVENDEQTPPLLFLLSYYALIERSLHHFWILKRNYEYVLSVIESTYRDTPQIYDQIFKLYFAAFSMILISLGETWQTMMNCLLEETRGPIRKTFSKIIVGDQTLKSFLDNLRVIRDAVSHDKIVKSQLYDAWFTFPEDFFHQAIAAINTMSPQKQTKITKQEPLDLTKRVPSPEALREAPYVAQNDARNSLTTAVETNTESDSQQPLETPAYRYHSCTL